MAKLFNFISVCGGILGGLLAYFLGGWDVLLKTIVFLAVADYVTGLIKAVYLKQLSSGLQRTFEKDPDVYHHCGRI